MNKRTDSNGSSSRNYDVIIVGSGMGALTTGSLLAQVGQKKVLVIESHFKLGGFLHSFRRKNYEWNPGVHYVGQMQYPSTTRDFMDLVTRKGVKWHRMESPFEKFIFPQETFGVATEPKLFKQQLMERFPDEKTGIHRYFRDLIRSESWIRRWFFSKQFPRPIANLMTFFGRRRCAVNTNVYLNRHIKDPLLCAILTAQWPDYGTPPSKSAFGVHATVAHDFLDGGYYPIGGSPQIVKHAVAAIEDAGGMCLVNHKVQQILIKNQKAIGVVVERKGETIEYYAPTIVSNAGAATTFQKLVPEPYGLAERKKLLRIQPGPSANILFLGLNDDPRKHGFEECNYWMYSRTDHEVPESDPETDQIPIYGAFFAIGSLRNPKQKSHTAQIIYFSEHSEWDALSNSEWKRRGDLYEEKKAKVAEAMLDFVEERLPGLRKLVAYQELSTPLTVESFTGHSGGQVYGQECSSHRLFRDQWSIATSVRNLYLTGTDIGLPGVNSALMAGVMTAGKLLGPMGMPKLFTAIRQNKA